VLVAEPFPTECQLAHHTGEVSPLSSHHCSVIRNVRLRHALLQKMPAVLDLEDWLGAHDGAFQVIYDGCLGQSNETYPSANQTHLSLGDRVWWEIYQSSSATASLATVTAVSTVRSLSTSSCTISSSIPACQLCSQAKKTQEYGRTHFGSQSRYHQSDHPCSASGDSCSSAYVQC
jgi:hypothetical protein